ncbi:MAG: HXXEE domain-containing protein [Chloroflexota bacterium]
MINPLQPLWRISRRLSFQQALLFAPVAYVLHHVEEHLLFDPTAWRVRFLPDANHIASEVELCLLVGLIGAALLLHALIGNRRTAQSAVFVIKATQLHNAVYHVGGTLALGAWMPGLLTVIVLYLPLNLLILRKARDEGWIGLRSGAALFVASGAAYWLYELLGPAVLLVTAAGGLAWIAVSLLPPGARRATEQRR